MLHGIMKRITIIGLIHFITLASAFSQTKVGSFYMLPVKVVDGDTIYCASIDEVYIFPEKKFSSRRESNKYGKLTRDLKIAYPYAKLAHAKLEEMNEVFLTLHTEKEKKAYTKKAEDELRAQFEGELVNLTITQGRLLIKLIDRETGETSYELVKELRGSFQAVFWQTVAKIFGSNLKSTYDANGEDKIIEEILQKIDAGAL
jgi:hypothetical protein